mmetsp:Transcript_2376/g.4188  ORF Transcript_2376/g.4188 Transcript_2376/m.4188 type:complete len:246 (-) Transcript_2376:72-809(-)
MDKNGVERDSYDGNVDKVVNLEDVLKRMVHQFVVGRSQGQSHWGGVRPAVTPSCAAHSTSYHKDVFSDSCTALTQEFLHAVVPFLAERGVRRGRLPNGEIVRLADVTNYRGNYLDASVPMFGRLSHDVLGTGEWFVDITGAQFRGQCHPVICWFYSVRDLHASFQGRPLQTFRKLHGDGGFVGPCHDGGVAKEMMRLVAGSELEGCCEWCHGKSSLQCSKCKSVSYCGRACQKAHWKNGHKVKCS